QRGRSHPRRARRDGARVQAHPAAHDRCHRRDRSASQARPGAGAQLVVARLYLSPPDLAGTELAMLTDAVQSNWIAPLGPHVDAFEAEMCARLDVPHAVALSSGTAALHLALLVLGVVPGDEVWVSTLTFAATANAVRYAGATPVFVDS